jgi:hypothetical protein
MATAIHCRYFAYPLDGPACALGVDLSKCGTALAAGCWNPKGGSCEKREPYTAAEIAASDAENDAAADFGIVAKNAENRTSELAATRYHLEDMRALALPKDAK